MFFYRLIHKLWASHFSSFLCRKIDGLRNNVAIQRFPHIGKGCYFGRLRNVKGESYIKIGNNVTILDDTIITAIDNYRGQYFTPELQIEDNVIINPYNHITCINKIRIGSGTLTGKNVTITDNSHGRLVFEESDVLPVNRPVYSKGPVVIGKNVWIGDKATILPNVEIGDGAIIGANSVVTKDIPPYSVAVGNPAKVVKKIKNKECQDQD